MKRRLFSPCALLVGVLLLAPATAAALPGRFLIVDPGTRGVVLFNPATGAVREVADGDQPAFLPGRNGFVYIRAGGCFKVPGSCYTQYSVFRKSLRNRDAEDPGRRLFGWREFFVRSVDAAPSGRLVFSAEPGPGPGHRGEGMEIYSAAADGSRVRQLTRNRVFDNDAAVSPDGRFVAFARRVDGQGQIFVMRIDGSHERRLTRDGRRNRSPSWSPDGRRIVFLSQGLNGRDVHAIGVDGSSRRRLPSVGEDESDPVYSPDGRWIAYLRDDLWVMRAGGTDTRRVLTPDRFPDFFEGGLDWGR
jgi:WD40 repeat protein